MIFEHEVIYTGYELKTSKKGNDYLMVNMLDATGKQFSCMLDNQENSPTNIKRLSSCMGTFKLELGRYMNLKLVKLVPMD